ncbi:AMP deaminase 3-like [Mobula birostris]|uniref:AMP deaminase 3-like n=1 Tax=Mobula birostris TaxID=1983395 RepID=UPI003B27E5D2
MLVSRFHLHQLANEKREFIDLQVASHSDFYNVAKVDTHIHAAACMNQHSLLRFIRHTYTRDQDREVHPIPGRDLHPGQLFQSWASTPTTSTSTHSTCTRTGRPSRGSIASTPSTTRWERASCASCTSRPTTTSTENILPD